jgi:hypothetical protein
MYDGVALVGAGGNVQEGDLVVMSRKVISSAPSSL